MNFSQITDDLFIGPMPTAVDYNHLYDLGVRLVLNMRFIAHLPQGVKEPPFDVLWLRTIDSPLFPMPIETLVRGVHAAQETISKGGKIYSHCAAGRHRSVAMGAAILIAQGHAPDVAMELIKAKRPFADPDIFYIKGRILAFAHHWKQEFREFSPSRKDTGTM